MAKELNFTLEGVQGDLKLKYGPFNQRLYQDGREIKKQGRFNPKYYVINTNGEKEEIKVEGTQAISRTAHEAWPRLQRYAFEFTQPLGTP